MERAPNVQTQKYTEKMFKSVFVNMSKICREENRCCKYVEKDVEGQPDVANMSKKCVKDVVVANDIFQQYYTEYWIPQSKKTYDS